MVANRGFCRHKRQYDDRSGQGAARSGQICYLCRRKAAVERAAAVSRRQVVHSVSDIARVINAQGFLPFFRGEIAGFSLEEMTPPELWFPEEDPQDNGVWDWKSDIILEADCAYARLYMKKMCFVSMAFYPDLVNVRRAEFRLNEAELALLKLLRERGTLLSREWKRLGGYAKPRAGRSNPVDRLLAAEERGVKERRSSEKESFDAAVTRLQMGGYVVSAAFEYGYRADGRRYGWGVARYVAAEDFFGPERLATDRTPQQSYDRLLTHLRALLPSATETQLRHIIL